MNAYKVTIVDGEMGDLHNPMNHSFTCYYATREGALAMVPAGAQHYKLTDYVEQYVLTTDPDEFISFFGHRIPLRTEVTIEKIELR